MAACSASTPLNPMIEVAREALGDRADYLVADLSELEVDEPVDVIFSTATFHWILDHDKLFARLHAGPAAGRQAGRAVRWGGQRRQARSRRSSPWPPGPSSSITSRASR